MARLPLSQTDTWHLDGVPDIRGWNVLDDGNHSVGRVEDLIVNTETEQVDSIVLESGDHYPVADIEIGDGVVFLHVVSTPETNPEVDEEPDLEAIRPGDLDEADRRAALDPQHKQYVGEFQPDATQPASEGGRVPPDEQEPKNPS